MATSAVAQGAGSAGATETPAAGPAAVFIDSVDVDVVEIDVVVTDKKGNRIDDLTAADFVLEEDGEPVDIEFFTVVRDGVAGREAALPVDDGSTAPVRAVVEAEPRFLIFLFDQRSLSGPKRKRFLKAADEFLESGLRPGDRAMVAVADRGLAVIQGFTDDPVEIRDAFTTVKSMSSGGTMAETARRYLVLDLVSTAFGSASAGAIDPGIVARQASIFGGKIQSQARELFFRTRDSLAALAVTVDSLAGLPGRKALVYVGEGLPIRPGEALFRAYANKFQAVSDNPLAQAADFESLGYDLTLEFASVTALAQDADVVLYTMDIAGRRTDLRASAAFGLSDIATQDATGGAPTVYDGALDLRREQNLRAGLEILAQGTGGRVLMNSSRFGDFLEDVDSDLGNYYSLGYSQERARDGELHKIEVKLRQGVGKRNWRVRYRKNYRHRTGPQLLEDLARAAVRVREAPNPLRMALQMDEPIPDGTGWLVDLAALVPAGGLTLVPGDGVIEGRIEAVVVIGDDKGNLSPTAVIPAGARFEGIAPEPEEPVVIAAARLALDPGRKVIALALRDVLSGESSVAILSIDLGDPAEVAKSATPFDEPAEGAGRSE